jgi:hypothetical protein
LYSSERALRDERAGIFRLEFGPVSPSISMGDPVGKERRKSTGNRRKGGEDRRNAERVADDMAPRRDPERPSRRKTDPPTLPEDH